MPQNGKAHALENLPEVCYKLVVPSGLDSTWYEGDLDPKHQYCEYQHFTDVQLESKLFECDFKLHFAPPPSGGQD